MFILWRKRNFVVKSQQYSILNFCQLSIFLSFPILWRNVWVFCECSQLLIRMWGMRPFSSCKYLGFIQWLHINNNKKRNFFRGGTTSYVYLSWFFKWLEGAMIYDHLRIHKLYFANDKILRLGCADFFNVYYSLPHKKFMKNLKLSRARPEKASKI